LAKLLLVSVLLQCISAAREDTLVGWQGEQYKDPSEDHRRKWNMEVLGWKPRAFLFHNFLTEEECDHLIATAEPTMAKSTVVDNASGKSVPSTIRTSSGTFLTRHQDEIVNKIEAKIAEASQIPEDNGEGLQILQYQIGQKYEAHYDYFHDKFNNDASKGGQRIATMLMYLSTVEEGGETVFPASVDKPHKNDPSNDWSSCAKRGIAVKAVKGDALLFWSLKPDGEEDTSSLHAGCPVIKGTKWSATKWMHVGKFGMDGMAKMHPPGACEDYNDNCKMWASLGECTKNSAFMVGSDGSAGECKLSCKSCVPKTAIA